MYDLVIRGGTLVDGTGAPSRHADVAIDGDQVVAVGNDLGEARREIDAAGLLVTPGWVDIHTHYDGQVTWDPHLTPSGWNGVTTVVMGNCGVGFAPVRPGQEDFLIQLMEGVEDIPGTALAAGIDWQWESFPEYLDAIDRMPRSIDVGAQIPHGAVRAYVMGERGAKNEKAEPEDIIAMAKIVKEGLEAGALGFTTSRTMLHRAKDGEVVPGTYAVDDEVMGIGRMLGEVGHGVFEVASDLAPEGAELEWMSRLGKETGRPVTFACLQNPIDGDQWKRLLEIVDRDAAEGGCLTPQVAQRPAGLLFGCDSSLHPFRLKPSFSPLTELPSQERLEVLARPEIRNAIIEEESRDGNIPGVAALVTTAWRMMYPLGDPPNYEPGPENSVEARAAAAGVSPAEFAYDLMRRGDRLYKPFLEVRARSYRLRLLNGSVSRYLKLALVDAAGNPVPFYMIANDGNIMEHSVYFKNGIMPTHAIAERYDIIVDFSSFEEGDRLYFVNLLEHRDGKRPKAVIRLDRVVSGKYDGDPAVGKFLEFRVRAYEGKDLSMNPADYVEGAKKMLPLPTFTEEELANARHRSFKFGRSNGTDSAPWTSKTDGGQGLGADPSLVSAAPELGSVEIWHLETGGGWAHPVHIHFEEGQILTKDGQEPPPWEKWSRKDVYRLGPLPDSAHEMAIAIRFREFGGSYMEHCHNTQHEDHAMLLRWDIEKPGQLVSMPTPMPEWEGCGYIETEELSTYKSGDMGAAASYSMPAKSSIVSSTSSKDPQLEAPAQEEPAEQVSESPKEKKKRWRKNRRSGRRSGKGRKGKIQ